MNKLIKRLLATSVSDIIDAKQIAALKEAVAIKRIEFLKNNVDEIAVPKLPISLSPGEAATLTELIKKSKLRNDLNASQYLGVMKLVNRKIPIPEHLVPPDLQRYEYGKPLQHMVLLKRKSGGRSPITGHIVVRHRGGGRRQKVRLLDRWRDNSNPQQVCRLEYDPLRNAKLALLRDMVTMELSYIICPTGVEKGSVIPNDGKGLVGNCMELALIPEGTAVHCIENRPGEGAAFVRVAGASATIISKDDKYVYLRMPSKFIVRVLKECKATIGQVALTPWAVKDWGKAGATRNRGIRPTVRAKAMNPVTGPGCRKGGLARSMWGKLANVKGKKWYIKHGLVEQKFE